MRAVLLAAGYGTRLECDLQNDASGLFSHLVGTPKPLLPIGGMPLVTHWIKAFDQVPEITSVVVVTNDLHKPLYQTWADGLARHMRIVSDGSTSNEERSGAVACMEIGAAGSQEDILFVAGDTLLPSDFSLKTLVSKFKALHDHEKEACLVLSAPVSEKNVSKHGIIEVEERNRVTQFLEKPQPQDTTSRLQCPCVYLMSSESLHHLQNFLEENRNAPLSCRDATGMFIGSLIHRAPVFAHHVTHRYDVGGLQSYLQCCQDFQPS
uniref:Nucleotidyl transferase domain-containing protein n=1 Tax=Scylla olivacea TaxID=85551 RepID=A0A0P4W351_SCYOL